MYIDINIYVFIYIHMYCPMFYNKQLNINIAPAELWPQRLVLDHGGVMTMFPDVGPW